VVQPLIFEHII